MKYLSYIYELLSNSNQVKSPVSKYIKTIILHGCPDFSQNRGCRPFLEIYEVKTNKLVDFK